MINVDSPCNHMIEASDPNTFFQARVVTIIGSNIILREEHC